MTDEVFTEPEEPGDSWVDVRMTSPDEGEWDVDFVVVDGRVSYVDLRIRPEFLEDFVACLLDDVGADRADSVLAGLCDERDIDVDPRADDE